MINKYLLLITLLILTLSSKSQGERNISVELGGIHILQPKYFTNEFCNYGTSLTLTKRINRIKVSSGISYSILYHTEIDSNNDLYKNKYKLQYVTFPILLSFILNKDKPVNFNIVSGVIFKKNLKYDITSYYLNKPYQIEDIVISNDTKIIARLGFGASKLVSKNIRLNFSSYFDYIKPYYDGNPRSKEPYIGSTIGFKLGIEYYLNVNL